MNKLLKQLLILFALFIITAALLGNLSSSFAFKRADEVSFSQLVNYILQKEVQEIRVKSGGRLEAVLKDSSLVKSYVVGGDLISNLKDYGATPELLKAVEIKASPPSGWENLLGLLVPIILPFLILGGIIYFFYRQAQGMGTKGFPFSSNPARQMNLPGKDGETSLEKNHKITFKNVAGVREAKEELIEVIDFLKNPKKFTDLGARIPRGVLLVGPPGCGKTMLAKAVAGEASVPFFHISGSEFMELFVGVGASRVRSLFQKAKRHAPCIIFIDELDSIGRKRGAGFGGAHDERDQTLNQILVEMDGFETDENVIVMAATNRPDVLDSALLRPGRFDRRVTLELPDVADREEILQVHGKGKPLAHDVNLRLVAERTPGFSGADLSNLMNEAAILTARKNKKQIGLEEILPSVEKVMLGPERKSRVIGDREKQITAYHEAGHAIIAHYLPNVDPVHKISIIARGQAGGYTLKMPERDKHLHTRSEFIDELSVSMAGLAAEKFKFQEMTTGAAGDLRFATQLARRLVTQYGMSDKIGPVSLESENNDLIYPWEEYRSSYSDDTLRQIDEEVARLLKTAYNKAVEMIEKNQAKLDLIANKLLEQESIEKEEFERLMKEE